VCVFWGRSTHCGIERVRAWALQCYCYRLLMMPASHSCCAKVGSPDNTKPPAAICEAAAQPSPGSGPTQTLRPTHHHSKHCRYLITQRAKQPPAPRPQSQYVQRPACPLRNCVHVLEAAMRNCVHVPEAAMCSPMFFHMKAAGVRARAPTHSTCSLGRRAPKRHFYRRSTYLSNHCLN
jgi:hypothetical protein